MGDTHVGLQPADVSSLRKLTGTSQFKTALVHQPPVKKWANTEPEGSRCAP